MEIVLEKPSVYLREMVRHIQDQLEPLCMSQQFVTFNNFFRKKLSNIARRRNAQRRAEFQMLIFVDETMGEMQC